MISTFPGWANFIALGLAYLVPLWLFFKLAGVPDNATTILLRICIVEFFAGAYLSKFRERKGGGLSFD
ncbi:MAG: hypothetical protein ABID54_10730, partial [Pseudomonadota bacterium]